MKSSSWVADVAPAGPLPAAPNTWVGRCGTAAADARSHSDNARVDDRLQSVALSDPDILKGRHSEVSCWLEESVSD